MLPDGARRAVLGGGCAVPAAGGAAGAGQGDYPHDAENEREELTLLAERMENSDEKACFCSYHCAHK